MSAHSLLHFVETDEFTHDWVSLGLDVERDLWRLQTTIMSAPEGAPVVRGTGGLRKLRFHEPHSNRGKRGAIRVCYAYFPRYNFVLLVAAYAKSRTADLSAADCEAIRSYLQRIEKYLEKRIHG